jgi:hypothetical protein
MSLPAASRRPRRFAKTPGGRAQTVRWSDRSQRLLASQRSSTMPATIEVPFANAEAANARDQGMRSSTNR